MPGHVSITPSVDASTPEDARRPFTQSLTLVLFVVTVCHTLVATDHTYCRTRHCLKRGTRECWWGTPSPVVEAK